MLVRTPPIRLVVVQLATWIKGHGWNVDISKVQMGLDDQDLLREDGDPGQGFNGIIAMVKDPQIENDIELADCLRREVCYIDLAGVHVDAKCRARDVKGFAAANLRI